MERIDLFEHIDLLPEDAKAVIDKQIEESVDDFSYDFLSDNLEELKAVGFRFDYYLDAVPFNLCAISFFEKLKKMYRDNLLANPYGEAASADAESKAEASLCQGFYTLITGEVKQITLNDLLGK